MGVRLLLPSDDARGTRMRWWGEVPIIVWGSLQNISIFCAPRILPMGEDHQQSRYHVPHLSVFISRFRQNKLALRVSRLATCCWATCLFGLRRRFDAPLNRFCHSVSSLRDSCKASAPCMLRYQTVCHSSFQKNAQYCTEKYRSQLGEAGSRPPLYYESIVVGNSAKMPSNKSYPVL